MGSWKGDRLGKRTDYRLQDAQKNQPKRCTRLPQVSGLKSLVSDFAAFRPVVCSLSPAASSSCSKLPLPLTFAPPGVAGCSSNLDQTGCQGWQPGGGVQSRMNSRHRALMALLFTLTLPACHGVYHRDPGLDQHVTESDPPADAASAEVSDQPAKALEVTPAAKSKSTAATTPAEQNGAAVAEVLAELDATGGMDRETSLRLVEDLRRTDPALWPQVVDALRASLAYRKQQAEGQRSEVGNKSLATSGATSVPRGIASQESGVRLQEFQTPPTVAPTTRSAAISGAAWVRSGPTS